MGSERHEKRLVIRMTSIAIAMLILVQFFSGIGSSYAESSDDDDERTYGLTLEFEGLADPGQDHYEGWIIIDGSPVSTGKFTVDDNGDLMDLDGYPIVMFDLGGMDMSRATDFVLSQEPAGDVDSVPSSVKPLAGSFNSAMDTALLTHNVGKDLSGITGEYILATPTDDASSDDYRLDIQLDGLAVLPSGHYEGWLIVNGAPVSTGKFNVTAGGDLVDHLTGAVLDEPFMVMDLDIMNTTKFVLSIEPDGDIDSIPGAVKPYAGDYNTAGESMIMHNVGVDLSSAAGEYILATPTNTVQPDDYDLMLEFENLMPLTTEHYEGWLIVDGSPVSTGKFNISAGGDIVDHMDGSPITDPFVLTDLDIDNVTLFVLTIEPEGDTDSVPGAIKPMAGAYESSTMDGMLSHNIGVDLSSVSGEFILATPTDEPEGNENSGIWFLNTTGPSEGLMVPDLSGTDWIYEGWVVIDGTPVTTGRFNMSDEADDFDLYSSTNNSGPPFPGEDFLQNAPAGLSFPTDLSGETAVISIEPRVDNEASPFQFKPLIGAIPDPATDHVEYPLDDMTHTLPTGTFELEQHPAPPSDENSGIWFLNTTGPSAGLTLPDLTGTDWVYEGWVVIDGIPVTTGTFTTSAGFDAFDGYSGVDASGPPFPGEDFLMDAPDGLSFPVDISGGTAVISIEPAVDDDPGPFQFKPLVGSIPDPADDHVNYHMDNKVDMIPMGNFTLTKAPSNENSGIWWLNRSTGSPVAGLMLPDLTGTDWIYEGWVVIDGTPVTTGRFSMVSSADDFNGYSASENSPPFPGEDFIMGAPTGLSFPTDLAGDTAVISIEPRVDSDPGPYMFKPLVGMIPAAAVDHLEYQMDDKVDTMATGTASISAIDGEDDDDDDSDDNGTMLIAAIAVIVIIALILVYVLTKK